MKESERCRLLFGPYQTPRFKRGDVVICEMRGEVHIVGLTDGKIPWPIGKLGRAKGPVVYAGLADALKRESGVAICHWWGVTNQTITKWRKAMGLPAITEGTTELKRRNFAQPWARKAQKKAWAKARDPERRREIAESKLGKSRPAHVLEAMRKGKLKKQGQA